MSTHLLPREHVADTHRPVALAAPVLQTGWMIVAVVVLVVVVAVVAVLSFSRPTDAAARAVAHAVADARGREYARRWVHRVQVGSALGSCASKSASECLLLKPLRQRRVPYYCGISKGLGWSQ